MNCSCGSIINQPKGEDPTARIVLEGVAADHYNGNATWTFSNMDKIFGQTAWKDHRFVNLECANMVIPDPQAQANAESTQCWFQLWRIRLSASSQAYNQSRAGASNKNFTPNLNYGDGVAGNGTNNYTNPGRENGDVNDVLFYMVGENYRQSNLVFAASEALAGELQGNKMCVAKEHLSQIQVVIEMYKPRATATEPILGLSAGGEWVELSWSETAFKPEIIRTTAQFCMVLIATPVSPENRA